MTLKGQASWILNSRPWPLDERRLSLAPMEVQPQAGPRSTVEEALTKRGTCPASVKREAGRWIWKKRKWRLKLRDHFKIYDTRKSTDIFPKEELRLSLTTVKLTSAINSKSNSIRRSPCRLVWRAETETRLSLPRIPRLRASWAEKVFIFIFRSWAECVIDSSLTRSDCMPCQSGPGTPSKI